MFRLNTGKIKCKKNRLRRERILPPKEKRNKIKHTRKSISEAMKVYLSEGGQISSMGTDQRPYELRPLFKSDDMFTNNSNF